MVFGSYGRNMFSFVRNAQTIFQSGCMVLHSQQHYTSVPHCSTFSPAFGVIRVSDFDHSNRCVVVSYYFICISLVTYDVEHLFICLFSICISLWWGVSYGFWPITKKVQIVLLLSFKNSLHILDDSLIRCIFCIFFPSPLAFANSLDIVFCRAVFNFNEILLIIFFLFYLFFSLTGFLIDIKMTKGSKYAYNFTTCFPDLIYYELLSYKYVYSHNIIFNGYAVYSITSNGSFYWLLMLSLLINKASNHILVAKTMHIPFARGLINTC